MKISKTVASILKGRIPGQLVIQLTDRCNARCPQCGMRKTERFERSRLSNDDIKKILDHAAVQGIQAVSFTGGEPLLYLDDLVELINYAGSVGIEFIRTGTNGFLFRDHRSPDFERRTRAIAEKLASTPLYTFWISMDSADTGVHEEMRGFPGVVRGIEKALPIFHEHGLFPSVNLGLNRNMGGDYLKKLNLPDRSHPEYNDWFYWENRNSLRAFYQRVINMGFSISNTCYPMSIDASDMSKGLNAIYGASSEEMVVRYDNQEKAILYQALMDTVPEFRNQIRIFTPRSALLSLIRHHTEDVSSLYPCRGGIDFFFVEAKDGNTYPCGYRGNENLGRFWDLSLKNIGRLAYCESCDWECFRDPSELFGLFLDGVRLPRRLIEYWMNDKRFLQLWMNDLRYYIACDYFNGRKPISFRRLSKFKSVVSPIIHLDVTTPNSPDLFNRIPSS